jgi:predicted ester cyclase
MSTEDIKALVRRLYEEVFNRGNLSTVDELLAANYIDHTALPGTSPGPEGLKQFTSMFHAAFPDLHFTIEDLIAEGDTVVVRQTYRGTHKGDLMGISPTGKQVTITSIDIGRFADGKLVEHWGATDSLGLLQQLGVVPSMG